MQQPNPLLLVNQKPIGSKALPDPRLMHKWGEQPVYVHNVDAAGWLAQGWTYEPQTEPTPESESEPVTPKDSEPAVKPSRKQKPDANV
jgi:hypothetical protein